MAARLLPRYLRQEILPPALLALLVYTFILLMNLVFQVAELAIRRSLPLGLVLQVVGLAVPRILVLTLPVAVLVGIMIGLSRLGSDGELVALHSLGVSDGVLYRAALALGLGGTLIASLLFSLAVPYANYAQHELTARTLALTNPADELQPRVFYEKVPGALLFAEEVPPGGPLKRLFLYRTSAAPERLEEMTLAREARIAYVTRGGELALEVELLDGASHAVDPLEPEGYQRTGFARQTVRLQAPPAVAARLRLLDEPPQKGLREQTPWELRRTIRDFERHPNPRVRLLLTREARMELHKQFATPCASLVLALLAVPLGLLNRRSPRSASFALSLAVILLYWVLMTAGEDLLRKEVLASPFVAAWAPNLFFLGLGVALSAPRLRGLLVATGIAARHWARRVLQPLRGRGSTSEDVDRRTLPLPSRRAQRWVPLLDWLVAGTFARILGFILLSAYVLYALVVAKGLIDNLLENELPMVLLLEYVAYRSPSLIVEYVLPVASLVAVLLTFAHLSRTGELLAMQAGGISRRRAALPVVVVTAALCLVSVLATETVLPAANQRAQERRAEIRGKRSPRTYYHPERRWVFGDEGRLYAYRRARSGGTLLEGFSLVKIDRERFRLQERWYASRAVWDGAAWQLRDGWVRRFPQGGGEQFVRFDRRRLALPEDPAFLAQEWAAPKNMNFVDLRRYVRDLAGAGYDVRELRVDLQTRLHTPWLALFMVLMALPLALRVSRHGHLAALALSLAIGIVYYPLLQVSAKLGELGTLPVSVAVWGPSLVFVAAGLAMLPRVRT